MLRAVPVSDASVVRERPAAEAGRTISKFRHCHSEAYETMPTYPSVQGGVKAAMSRLAKRAPSTL